MKELEARKAELTERLKNILAARESLDRGSDSFGSTLAKSHEEESIIKSELEIIEIMLQGIELAGDLMKNLPSIDQLKFMALSKAEAMAPKIKSALSELFGGVKISETEKTADEIEVHKNTQLLYESLKSLYLLDEHEKLTSLFDELKQEYDGGSRENETIIFCFDCAMILEKAGQKKFALLIFKELFEEV